MLSKLDQSEVVGSQVYRILRKSIVSGELVPGTSISEAEISKHFSISRQPVRESFIKLRDEGLVIVRPQRGTLVAKISIAAVMDARFIREAVEADIVSILAEQSDSAVVAELRQLITRQRNVPKIEMPLFIELDEQFHHFLADAAGKSHVWNLIDGVKAQMDRVRYLSLMNFPVSALILQHEEIVDAIEQGNKTAANNAMRLHLKRILTDLPQIAKARPEMFEEATHES